MKHKVVKRLKKLLPDDVVPAPVLEDIKWEIPNDQLDSPDDDEHCPKCGKETSEMEGYPNRWVTLESGYYQDSAGMWMYCKVKCFCGHEYEVDCSA